MPVLDGKRVTVAEWRAATAPEPVAEVAEEAAPEKPKRSRASGGRRSAKKDVVAQVQAAMGLAPEAPAADEAPAAEAPAEAADEPAAEEAAEEASDEVGEDESDAAEEAGEDATEENS